MKARLTDLLFAFGCFLMFILVSCTRDGSHATAVPIDASSPTVTAADPITQTQPNFYNEAPALAQQVKQGTLAPIEERLPNNPMLVQPERDVGQYGGNLYVPVSDIGLRLSIIGYEPLLRWDSRWLRVLPNVAQVVDSSEDATTYTIHLREKMRWSDGHPFTADDILFWYEDVFGNIALTPNKSGWLSAGGVSITVEKVDNLTVTFRFAEPNSLFLLNLAGLLGETITRYPRHYLEQFHLSYNPNADSIASAAGAADWAELFHSKSEFANPDLPVLHAWVIKEVSNGRLVAERNPYYWKVDTEFNQLPYLDRVTYTNNLPLQQADPQDTTEAAYLFFRDDFETVPSPQFTAVTLVSSFSSSHAIALNLNHPDPTLRAIFQNVTFRQGLSHAINRPYMIETLFGGKGVAYQPSPRPESPYYNEQLATQFTTYDVSLANELLDKAGYSRRDEAGYRLRPDGRRITIRLQSPHAYQEPLLQALQADWQAIGIETTLNIYANINEYSQDLFTNQHDTFISEGVGGLNVLQQPVYYFPLHPFASWYARGWAQWFVDPNAPTALEPPAATQTQMALYRQLKATTNPDEQAALMTQILDITITQFYVMGTVLDPNSELLISQNLQNVPLVMPLSAIDFPAPATSNPAQFFIE